MSEIKYLFDVRFRFLYKTVNKAPKSFSNNKHYMCQLFFKIAVYIKISISPMKSYQYNCDISP